MAALRLVVLAQLLVVGRSFTELAFAPGSRAGLPPRSSHRPRPIVAVAHQVAPPARTSGGWFHPAAAVAAALPWTASRAAERNATASGRSKDAALVASAATEVDPSSRPAVRALYAASLLMQAMPPAAALGLLGSLTVFDEVALPAALSLYIVLEALHFVFSFVSSARPPKS